MGCPGAIYSICFWCFWNFIMIIDVVTYRSEYMSRSFLFFPSCRPSWNFHRESIELVVQTFHQKILIFFLVSILILTEMAQRQPIKIIGQKICYLSKVKNFLCYFQPLHSRFEFSFCFGSWDFKSGMLWIFNLILHNCVYQVFFILISFVCVCPLTLWQCLLIQCVVRRFEVEDIVDFKWICILLHQEKDENQAKIKMLWPS